MAQPLFPGDTPVGQPLFPGDVPVGASPPATPAPAPAEEDTPSPLVERLRRNLARGGEVLPQLRPIAAALDALPSSLDEASEIGGDLVAGFGQGSNSLLQLGGTAYGLTSGHLDNWLTRQGERGIQYWGDRKSKALKALEQGRADAVARARAEGGEWAAAWAALSETYKSPRLLASFLAEQVPMLVPGLGAASKGAQLARGLGATEAVAGTVGTGTAWGVNAILQGADGGQQAIDQLRGLPLEMWAANPDVKKLMEQGASFDDARESVLVDLSRDAAKLSSYVSLLTNMFPGANLLEKAFTGVKMPGGIVSRGVRGLIGEGLQEGTEEGSAQYAANRAEQAINTAKDRWEGVGEAAGLGAAAAPFGALASMGERGEADPLPDEAEQATRKILQSESDEEALRIARDFVYGAGATPDDSGNMPPPADGESAVKRILDQAKLDEMVDRAIEATQPEGTPTHERGSTQFALNEEQSRLIKQAGASQIDPNDLAEGGLEDRPHVTILYGLELGEEESSPELARKLRGVLADAGEVQATVGGIEIFEGEDSDVIVQRLQSQELQNLHERIRDSLPNEQTYPDYKPHITIGYVRKGTGEKYRNLRTGLEGQVLVFDSLEAAGRNEDVTAIPLLKPGQEIPTLGATPSTTPPKGTPAPLVDRIRGEATAAPTPPLTPTTRQPEEPGAETGRTVTPETPETPETVTPVSPVTAPTQAADVVSTHTGRKIGVQFELRELDELITSDNPQFPARLQPRDRSRADSDDQIREIIKNFDPARLGASAEADRGAPIVGKDRLFVESGNGRVMSLRRIYADHPERAEQYRQFLREQGYNIEGMTAPVLIRRRVDDMSDEDLVAFTDEANVDATKRMSASEEAKRGAKILTPEVLSLYAPGAAISATPNQDFVRAYVAKVPAPLRSEYMQDDGALSVGGVLRIRNALLEVAYGRTERSNERIKTLTESTDDETRALSSVLTDMAPTWALLRQDIAQGDIPAQFDVTDALLEAIDTVAKARREGLNINDLLAQGDMFGGMSDGARAITRNLYTESKVGLLGRALGAPRVIEYLQNYIRNARNQSTAQGGLFGNELEVTPVDLLRQRPESQTAPEAEQGDLLTSSGQPAPAPAPTTQTAPPEDRLQGTDDALHSTASSAEWGATNTRFPKARADAALEKLRQKGSQANVGFDPELATLVFERVAFHVEAGARKLTQVVKRMVAEVGQWIAPYVPGAYSNVRLDPTMSDLVEEMDGPDVIEKVAANIRAGRAPDAGLTAEIDAGANPVTQTFTTTDAATLGWEQWATGTGSATARSNAAFNERMKAAGLINAPWSEQEPLVDAFQKAYSSADQTPWFMRHANYDEFASARRWYENSSAQHPSAKPYQERLALLIGNNADHEARYQEERNASGATGNLEQDRPDTDTANPVGGGTVSPAGRPNVGGSGSPGAGPRGAGSNTEGGSGVPDTRPADGGTGSDTDIYRPDGSFGPDDGTTTDRLTGTRDDVGAEGLSPESGRRTDAAESPDEGGAGRDGTTGTADTLDDGLTPRERQKRADRNVAPIAADAQNIAASVPALLPGQVDDVARAESWWQSQPDLRGVLITNGTGTGKTFSSLGILKRLFQRGEARNALIVVNSQTMASVFQREAVNFFDLDAEVLPDTKTPGTREVAITTYAAYSANPTLADRRFDALIYDEAHYLMRNEAGDYTAKILTHYAMSHHPEHTVALARMRSPFRQNYEDWLKRAQEWQEKNPKRSLPDELTREQRALADAERAEGDRIYNEERRPHVVFLSATPLAHHKNLQLLDQTVLAFGKPGKRSEGQSGAYNAGNEYQKYLMTHLGYRMRTGKLTQPESGVDRSLMERAWHEHLKAQNAIISRMLDVPFDYSRVFHRYENSLGEAIDAGMWWIRGYERDPETRRLDRIDNGLSNEAKEFFRKKWDYLFLMTLIEGLNADESVRRAKLHVAMGRKVVAFHRYITREPSHPFRIKPGYFDESERWIDPDGGLITALGQRVQGGPNALRAEIEGLRGLRPDLYNLPLTGIRNPVEAFQEAFGTTVAIYNGKVSKAKRLAAIRNFNTDGGPVSVFLAQITAGREGVSLHDVTGKHQRVVIQVGLPTEPIDLIQTEGRIYRVGVKSNAIYEMLRTGLSYEDKAFAQTIAQRSSTVENMAMGDQARSLLDSIVDAYVNAEPGIDPNPDQGTGGKQRDQAVAINAWDMAKTAYWSNRKGRQNDIGRDYFPTPEPLGLKMVEWAELAAGEKALEPSAGHGAIARWFPRSTANTYIELEDELADKVQIRAPQGNVRVMDFMDLPPMNKFHAIVMNPPFGLGGSDALPHMRKAAERHLYPGGRLVAIYPAGQMADKRLEKWLYEDDMAKDLHTRLNMLLPSVTFGRAGTGVMTRVLVIDYLPPKYFPSPDTQQSNRDLTYIEDINALFDVIQDMGVPRRNILAEPVGMEDAPSIIDNNDLTAIPTDVPARQAAPDAPAETPEPAGLAQPHNQKHTRTGEDQWLATLSRDLPDDQYKQVSEMAKDLGGYWSRYANRSAGVKKGFAFPTEEKRNLFIARVNRDTNLNEDRPAYDPAPGIRYDAELSDGLAEVFARRGKYPNPQQLELLIDMPEQHETRQGPPAALERAQDRADDAIRELWRSRSYAGRAMARDLAQRQRTMLVGQTIRSATDLATIAQVYRDPRFETARWIFTDDNGRILLQYAATTRSPGSAAMLVTVNEIAAPLMDIASIASGAGATQAWLMHNHPSGDPTPSEADISTTAGIALALFETVGLNGKPLLQFRGHVVIDTDRYGFIDETGKADLYQYAARRPETERPTFSDVGRLASNVAVDAIRSKMDVMTLYRKSREIQENGIYATALMVDSKHQVLAVVPFDFDPTQISRKALRAMMTRYAIATNAAAAFVHASNASVATRFIAAKVAIDVVWTSATGRIESMLSNGSSATYLRDKDRMPRLAPATSPEFADLPALEFTRNAWRNYLRIKRSGRNDFREGEYDYRGGHRATGDEGAPAHNLTHNGIYPDDFYTGLWHHYISRHNVPEQESADIALSLKGRPNRPVKIYRAVPHTKSNAERAAILERQLALFMSRGLYPDNVDPERQDEWYRATKQEAERLRSEPGEPAARLKINPGDWVSISRAYAVEHGESEFGKGNYRVVSKTVRAKDIYTNGDSIAEWGYFPDDVTVRAPVTGYHGSPYTFSEFRTDRIGTGEGGQAFGWGLYFASLRDIAAHYRKSLSARQAQFGLDGVIQHPDDIFSALQDAVRVGSTLSRDDANTVALEVYAGLRDDSDIAGMEKFVRQSDWEADYKDAWLAGLAQAKKYTKTQPEGRIYTADLPDDDNMMLWDRPYGDQPEAVRAAIRVAVIKESEPSDSKWLATLNGLSIDGFGTKKAAQHYIDTATLGEMYQGLSAGRGQRGASEFLLASGVRGIKYLDGTSRSAGEGSFNYVVFDEADIAITDIDVRSIVAAYDPQPNTDSTGRPVHPTPDGVKEFWRWFQRSAVTDNDGAPLVVYHSTRNTFDSFTQTSDIGWHFGTLEQAENRLRNTSSKQLIGENILPVYLSIQNPMRLNDMGTWEQKDIVAGMTIAGVDFSDMDEAVRRTLFEDGKEIDRDAFVRLLESKGYDGIVYRNEEEGSGDSYIALRPEQIKSAVGNRGTFDPNDSRIQFAITSTPIGLWSGLERAALALKQERGSPAQMLGALMKANGVKREEIAFTGLEEYLAAFEGRPVTRAQLLEFVRGHGVKVEVVTLKDDFNDPDEDPASRADGAKRYEDPVTRLELEELLDIADTEGNVELFELMTAALEGDRDALDEAEEIVRTNRENSEADEDENEGIYTQFAGHGAITVMPPQPDSPAARLVSESKHQIAAAMNYREHLIRLPVGTPTDATVNAVGDSESSRVSIANHWDHVASNVMSHIRTTDRALQVGGVRLNALVSEEIQSDWHQQARARDAVMRTPAMQLDENLRGVQPRLSLPGEDTDAGRAIKTAQDAMVAARDPLMATLFDQFASDTKAQRLAKEAGVPLQQWWDAVGVVKRLEDAVLEMRDVPPTYAWASEIEARREITPNHFYKDMWESLGDVIDNIRADERIKEQSLAWRSSLLAYRQMVDDATQHPERRLKDAQTASNSLSVDVTSALRSWAFSQTTLPLGRFQRLWDGYDIPGMLRNQLIEKPDLSPSEAWTQEIDKQLGATTDADAQQMLSALRETIRLQFKDGSFARDVNKWRTAIGEHQRALRAYSDYLKTGQKPFTERMQDAARKSARADETKLRLQREEAETALEVLQEQIRERWKDLRATLLGVMDPGVTGNKLLSSLMGLSDAYEPFVARRTSEFAQAFARDPALFLAAQMRTNGSDDQIYTTTDEADRVRGWARIVEATPAIREIAHDLAALHARAVSLNNAIAPTEDIQWLSAAPFAGNGWVELSMKHLIRTAVLEGKDAVALTGGLVHAMRWHADGQKIAVVDQLIVERDESNERVHISFSRLGSDEGGPLNDAPPDWSQGRVTFVPSPDGADLVALNVDNSTKYLRLSELVGTDTVAKILANQESKFVVTPPAPAVIGTSPFFAAYDGVHRNTLKAVAQRLDKSARIETTEMESLIEYGDGDTTKLPLHVLRITDQMRARVLGEGLSLFDRTNTLPASAPDPLAALPNPIPRNVLDAFLAGVRMPEGVNLNLLNASAIPEEIARQQPAGRWARAWTIDGDVNIVVDRVQSLRDLQKLVAHELWAHVGGNAVVGDKWATVVEGYERLKKLRGKTFDSIHAEVMFRYGRLSPVEEVKEFIAVMAERRVDEGPLARWWRQVQEFVVRGLRAMGMTRPMGLADLNIILSAGRAYIDGTSFYDRRRGAQASTLSFSLDDEFEPHERPLVQQIGMGFQGGLRGLRARMYNQWRLFQGRRWDYTRQAVLDQYNSFRKVLNDPRSWKLANLAAGTLSALEAALTRGRLYLENDVLKVHTNMPSLQDILEPLGRDVNRFLAWVAAHRAERLKAEGRENLFEDHHIAAFQLFNQPGTPGTVTYRPDRPEIFATALRELEQWQASIVQVGVDTGLINDEEAELWRTQGWYVPFYRVLEDEQDDTGPRISLNELARQTAYRRLRGGVDQLDDLFVNFLGNANHIIAASMRNHAARAALATATQVRNQSGQPIATRIHPPYGGVPRGAIWVRNNGRPEWYQLDHTDPESNLVLESLLSINWQGMNGIVGATLRKAKRMLTYGVTADPNFKIANGVRDTLAAIAITGLSPMFWRNIASGWRATRDDGTDKADMLASGAIFAESGYIHGADPDEMRFWIERNHPNYGQVRATANPFMDAARALGHGLMLGWEAYQDFGARLENINRAAEWVRLQEAGASDLDAAFAARDFLDFSRMGGNETVRWLTQSVPFLNARLQGLDKLGRSAVDPAQRARFHTTWAIYSALSVLLYLLIKDDDEYKRLEQWKRDANHYFRLWPGSPLFKIPRPFEVGAIAMLFERATEQWVDASATPRLFRERLTHALLDTFAMNPTPAALRPLLEINGDLNWFTGRPIEGDELKEVRAPLAYQPWTGTTVKGASAAIYGATGGLVDPSPVQIEHMVRGYFGWLGTTAIAAADAIIDGFTGAPEKPAGHFSDSVIARRFMETTPQRNTRAQTEFYDMLNAVQEAAFSAARKRKLEGRAASKAYVAEQGDEEAIRLLPRMRTTARRLAARRARIDRITNDPNLSAEEKQQQIDALLIKQDETAARAVERIPMDVRESLI